MWNPSKISASSFSVFKRGSGYLKTGIQDPAAAVYFAIHGREKLARHQTTRLLRSLDIEARDVYKYYDLSTIELVSLEKHLSDVFGKYFSGRGISRGGGFDLYVILRLLQPERIVETGVEGGLSSAYILQALENNNKGTLYSIDYPIEPAVIKKGSGFAIPDSLKERWILKIGKSSDVLNKLLSELDRIDIFLHDSEHTYENMMFEFSAVWDRLPEKGVLLSHDVSLNRAFYDFAKKIERKPIILYSWNLGIIIK